MYGYSEALEVKLIYRSHWHGVHVLQNFDLILCEPSESVHLCALITWNTICLCCLSLFISNGSHSISTPHMNPFGRRRIHLIGLALFPDCISYHFLLLYASFPHCLQFDSHFACAFLVVCFLFLSLNHWGIDWNDDVSIVQCSFRYRYTNYRKNQKITKRRQNDEDFLQFSVKF